MMKEYALIGKPLGHSFSRSFFTEKFAREGIDARYVNIELDDISQLTAKVMERKDLMGFNITYPYKRDVIPFLDSMTARAREVGAVNVVRIQRDAAGHAVLLEGDNVDVVGFMESCPPLPAGSKALICGTGGAAHAAAYALKESGLTPIFVSRTPGAGKISYQEVDESLCRETSILVNATPLGMKHHADEAPPFPYHLLCVRHFCFELTYNPYETPFLSKCLERGAAVRNGLAMLIHQADASWRFWNER